MTNELPFTLPARLFDPSCSKRNVVLQCIDCHAGGEPARVVLAGVPELPKDCDTAWKKRSYMMQHMDHLRKILLLEPRGYPCQNANFIFPATSPGGNIQYVIAEQNKIYPLMSGHNTICVATALLECGVVPMQEPDTTFTLEAPAGEILITAKCENGKAKSIAFRNAASFVEKLDVIVDVPQGVGPVKLDIAFGGMWYAIVDMEQFQGKAAFRHLTLDGSYGKELCRLGEMIKVACREQNPVQHPEQDYPGVDILAFTGEASPNSNATCRNAVIMSNSVLHWDKPETWTAMIDRSPCGTGTCAIMAALHARGNLGVGDCFVHESIVGSQFIGKILQENVTIAGGRKGIIPEIEGFACISQYSQVVVDPNDPFPEGYRVGDIW